MEAVGSSGRLNTTNTSIDPRWAGTKAHQGTHGKRRPYYRPIKRIRTPTKMYSAEMANDSLSREEQRMLAQAIFNSEKDQGIDNIDQLTSIRNYHCHDTNNEFKSIKSSSHSSCKQCTLQNSSRCKICQACELPRQCSLSSLSDTMLSNDTALNARENNVVAPSMKCIWARHGSHEGATAHQAELLERPTDDNDCVWVKWTTGEEECIPETHLVEMPSKRQRKRPTNIIDEKTANIKIQNVPVRAAASLASGQSYSVGTPVCKYLYDEEKDMDCQFSSDITAYNPEEGLYLITYKDGDEEELNKSELDKIVVNAFNKISKSIQHGKQDIPAKTATKWSITNDLNMTREEIEESLPDFMREMFHECCWVEGEGWHRPVLILSPFDLSGDVDIVKEWIKKYKIHRKNSIELPFMIYWYERGWLRRGEQKTFKAFSFAKREKIIDYELGLTRGYHTPFEEEFQKFAYELKPTQDNLIRGINQMMEDSKLAKAKRGGPVFFPHLKHEKKQKYKFRMNDHQALYDSWLMSDKYKKCILNASSNQEGHFSNTVQSLELFSGTAVLSKALKAVGFNTTTLDSDPNRDAMSKLSIREVEEMIIDGGIKSHQHLDKIFNVIWAAPCCTTWSKAANGIYRNTDFIDGHPFYKSEERAIQARMDIEALVNAIAFYMKQNPELIITIENPMGLLRHHPVEQLFYKVLGLSRVTISYCMFSTQNEQYPVKNTDLWTNSSRLLSEFKDGKFRCQKDTCGCTTNHIKVQDMPDRCSSYPREVCRRISALLDLEVKDGKFLRNSMKKSTQKVAPASHTLNRARKNSLINANEPLGPSFVSFDSNSAENISTLTGSQSTLASDIVHVDEDEDGSSTGSKVASISLPFATARDEEDEGSKVASQLKL